MGSILIRDGRFSLIFFSAVLAILWVLFFCLGGGFILMEYSWMKWKPYFFCYFSILVLTP